MPIEMNRLYNIPGCSFMCMSTEMPLQWHFSQDFFYLILSFGELYNLLYDISDQNLPFVEFHNFSHNLWFWICLFQGSCICWKISEFNFLLQGFGSTSWLQVWCSVQHICHSSIYCTERGWVSLSRTPGSLR